MLAVEADMFDDRRWQWPLTGLSQQNADMVKVTRIPGRRAWDYLFYIRPILDSLAIIMLKNDVK